jgi:hypothetical protein
MSPDWKQLFETSWNKFWSERDTKIDEAAQWGLPQPPEEFEKSSEGKLLLPLGVFTFAEAVKQDWRKHRNVRELTKFLRNNGYPKNFLASKLLSETGYRKALENQAQSKRPRPPQ